MTTSADTIRVTAMRPEDWSQVAEIYAEGIATGISTFETEVPDWQSWDAQHLREHRLVARDEDGVLGWAALSRVSIRDVYRGVAEISVYVAEAARGRRVGELLVDALVASAEEGGIWTIEAVVFPENEASVAMLQSCGFRIVGRREKLGRLRGVWRDVLLIERRSPVI